MSDGFSEVQGLFDVISWNSKHQSHTVLQPLLADISSHLIPSVMVILNLSEPEDVTLLEVWISKNGFRS